MICLFFPYILNESELKKYLKELIGSSAATFAPSNFWIQVEIIRKL
jgi:hypothetical protein